MNYNINEDKFCIEEKKSFSDILGVSISNDSINFENNNFDGIFEMEDFTNLTQFERICFTFEVILRKWNIHNKKVVNFNEVNIKKCRWIKKSSKFVFKEKNYIIKYYCPEMNTKLKSINKLESLDCSKILMNKFYNNVPSFINEFGIVEWLFICPESEKDIISNKNDLILLMSCLESCDANCTLPFIVQFDASSKHIFYGFQKSSFSKYEFKSCYLKTTKTYFKLPIDIKNIFFENFKYDTVDIHDILHTCEIEYSYLKKKNKNDKFTPSNFYDRNEFLNQLFKILNYKNETEEINNLINEFKLFIRFDGMPYNDKDDWLKNENDILLMEKNSSKWFCQTEFKNIDSQFLTGILKQYLTFFNTSTHFNTSIQDILFNVNEKLNKKKFTNSIFFSESIKIDSNDPMDLLFKTITIKEIRKFQAISKEIIQTIFNYVKNPSSKFNKNKCYDDEYLFIKKTLKNSKTGPSYSIVELISLTIGIIIYKEKNGIIFSCLLWNEFLNFLQHNFENCKYLPGISKKQHPEFGHSIFQQNIELLQCCIYSRKKWKTLNDYQIKYGRDIKSDIPLYHHPNEYIFIPVLQDKIPQTEETFLREIENFVETNSDERHINQLSFLTSDMSAFKAANPKCCFKDFIRWHSPNDWILNNENKKYELSIRMSGNDNIWKKTWDKSKPISIYKQKKHFDESEEWKKTIDKLKNLTFGEMIQYTLPNIFKSIIQILFDNFEIFSLQIKKKFRKLSITFCQCTFQIGKVEVYQNILNEINYIEKYIEKDYHLRRYFFNYFINEKDISYIEYLIMGMAENGIIKIENNKRNLIKYLIEKIFYDQNDNFCFSRQIPTSKRYIFSFYDARIYVSFSGDETRIYSKMPNSYINIKKLEDNLNKNQYP
ncbi:Rab3 GTPase-activating protein catalytic subunit [Strongyloides ratti]|uniref:Rab3 GTPase-activating protein catalytic subunit n=1 Tax=Strongyloides ratti TaxID=34506 RepID=A0A090L8H9_STRRB|nr:Rab3 GTPase-activating protein catalytic subunit [Strongyloides ratti]CEF63775.1 Rab3 GTPase-activating protein catalytic subunit [Strongyloides ratti]